MTTPISNNKLPFWTPVVNWKAPSTFSNLLIQLGIFADQYAYLGNQEIHLHARRVTDEKVYFATEKESKSSLARIIFKVSTFVLSFFILPAIALSIKCIYKSYVNQLPLQASTDACVLKNLKPARANKRRLATPSTPNNVRLAEKTFGEAKVVLVIGDLTDECVDLIVNAANARLLAGSGVCGAIHNKAGSGVFKECSHSLQSLKREQLNPGEALLTSAGSLAPRVKGIVHAVGPDCNNALENLHRAQLLKKTYERALELAIQPDQPYRTIAFPSISTGIYGFPVEEAAQIALNTVKEFLTAHPKALDEVRFVFLTPLSGDLTVNVYNQIFDTLEIQEIPLASAGI